MASVSELMVSVSADTSALEAALEKAQAGILVVLRRQYIAEGSPHGDTPEGFDAWLAKREALIDPRFDVTGSRPVEFTAPHDSLDRFRLHLDRMRKGPPGSADDCEFCHPEREPRE